MVVLAKTIAFFKKTLVSLGSLFVFKPGKSILRVFFKQLVVRPYAWYYSMARKFGWKGRDTRGLDIGKELVHILAFGLIFIVVFLNVTANTRAQDINKNSSRNLLASLVTSEFGVQEADQLIEEFYVQNPSLVPVMQDNYDSLANFKAEHTAEMKPTETENETTDFSQAVDYDPTFVHPDMSGGLETKIVRREIMDYTVEEGDTISTIAEKFGIGVSSILWENDLNAQSIIRPGDTIKILPVSGVSHKVVSGESVASLAAKYSATEQDIIATNDLQVGQSLIVGQKLIIPGGKKQDYASFRPKTYSGFSVIKDIIKPVSTYVKQKEKQYAPSISNQMTWPTAGYRITQYFSWRHFAIDVANHIGTPLYAADAGVVEFAGWSNGYGNNIMINHGGGKKTRYAHASKLYVQKGDKVAKGEQIAAMGSTGWSTGSHIHFEVIINGVKYNPLNYVH